MIDRDTAASRRIAVSGASGLVGSAFVAFARDRGDEVLRIVRRDPTGSGRVRWDPAAGNIDRVALEGLDAVVHLAGENIASGRWTAARKARLLESRVKGTTLLSEALATLSRPPEVLVSASAVGIYGDRDDELLDDESPAGSGFLAEVARAWEGATEPAARAGIRVVKLRIGVVLSVSGGALAKMLMPFRLGIGGRLGSGDQIVSWISLPDLVRAIRFVIAAPGLSGAVNATSPEPVTNAELTRALARVLRRPAFLPAPAWLLRVFLGEMAEMVLAGADVRPRRLEAAGFRFEHRNVEQALRFELDRRG